MDPSEIANTVVSSLSPYLVEAGKEAAKKVGGAVGEQGLKLSEWIKTKMTTPSVKAAVAELEKSPEDVDSRTLLQIALKKELTANEALREELVAFLKDIGPETPAVHQEATQTGKGNISIQIAGSGNTVGSVGKKS